MKILFLIEELNGGGKERRLVELLKGLSKETDFEIHLALTKSQNDYPEVNRLPITIHRLYGVSNIALIFEYRRLLGSLSPDVVHAWSYKTSFYASILKPFYNFKFIVCFISDTFGFSYISRLFAKMLIFNNADFVVGNSKAGLAAYQVPKPKGRVVYNGFDPSRVSDGTRCALQEIGIITPLKVVMLANVTSYKNYPLFIDVAKEILSKRDDVTFVSIGKVHPEFEDLVKPYINSRHSRIRFLGFRGDVQELIKDFDVGVLCTYTEGVSNAIIELMANGIPVITNDLEGGSREVIESFKDGIICEDDLLVDYLDRLLSNAALRRRFSRRCVRKISKDFSLNAMVNGFIRLYE